MTNDKSKHPKVDHAEENAFFPSDYSLSQEGAGYRCG